MKTEQKHTELRDAYLRECADNVARTLEVAESGSKLEFDILLKSFGEVWDAGQKSVLSANYHERLIEALRELATDAECYCTDNVALRGPCGHCKAESLLAELEGK